MDPTRPRHQLQRPRAVPNDDEGDDAEHFDVNQFEQHEIEDDDVRTERTRAQALEAVLLGRAEQGWTSHHGCDIVSFYSRNSSRLTCCPFQWLVFAPHMFIFFVVADSPCCCFQ